MIFFVCLFVFFHHEIYWNLSIFKVNKTKGFPTKKDIKRGGKGKRDQKDMFTYVSITFYLFIIIIFIFFHSVNSGKEWV